MSNLNCTSDPALALKIINIWGAEESKSSIDASSILSSGQLFRPLGHLRESKTRMLVSSRSEKEKAVNVQVLLRCRPFSEDELRNNAPQVVTCNEFQKEVSVSQAIAGKQFDRVFTFDKVFGPSAKQKDLYEQAIIPIVNEVLEGFNCTIFAYGQTGTGKTYTMEGECRRTKKASKDKLPLDAGVIPRAVKQIFDALESQHTDYSVKVTFLELYNEEITDLLAPEELSKISLEEKQKKQLPLMEDGKGGVLVRGLEEEIVTSADEIFSLLERGSSKRRTAETLLNKQSSRSHSLFSITIHIKEATPEGEELIKSGKLNLVDLAGSENISRSGAREGRAREAGEINKSLLTLGRVITALVEHLGHIPYRDSKLTRLLRDSLGGRTKTCIIATVSPSVHCLEETLSTLDYAHRAKNIKNRPEVNQKMMKSTLIKDLYGEIDRLKAEVYATREKVGVYIPKERYYQEEAERKAMTEQIEQMGVLLEANQKQIQELQEKYNLQLQQTTVMSKKLIATERSLDHTNKQFATAKEDLQYSHYQLKEKDFIIAEQRKAENALAHQAFALKQDNASLFSKIAREDQLSAANKSLVDKFRADLSERIDAVCSLLASSIKRQNMHLQTVEQLSKSCLEFHDKALIDLKEKVSASRLTYAAHIEGMQNAITLHKATNNSSLEELSSAASANSFSLDHLLALGGADASLIFTELQHSLSNFRGEIAQFTGELRKRFSASLDHSMEISGFVFLLVEELREKSSLLQNHSNSAHEAMIRSITEFQRTYEEQTRSDTDKLVAFISSYMLRQKEMVDARLDGLKDAALESKAFLDRHASSAASTSGGAKRRWEEFYLQMRHDSTDGSDFSSAKHCRLEAILQQCVDSADATCQQWEKVRASASEMCAHQAKEMDAIISDAMESNERHGAEALAMRVAVEEDAAKNGAELIQQLDEVMDRERRSAGKAMAATESHRECLQKLGEDHSSLASGINSCAAAALQHDYMVYEASGETPLKGEEADVPDGAAIESLRAMPVDAMLEEFRENNPYEPAAASKPSLIPRSPLNQIN